MITRKYLLFFLCLSLYQMLPAQDGKLSWYYPKLGEADPQVVTKSGGKMLNLHGVSGCASGNCKSGTGEFLAAYPSEDTVLGFMAINPVIKLTLYKGQFSNDGRNFDGTVYTRSVYYDVTYKKDNPRLIPKIKEDLRDDAFWKPYEVASGSMEKSGGVNYRWNGWMQPVQKTGVVVPAGQQSSFKAYFKDHAAYVKIQYAPGGVYTEIEGRAFENGELLGGRIQFTDGSVYEGFVHNGKRFGPGRYTTKEGIKEEGIWMLDSLAIPTAVNLPKALFEPELETVPTIGKFTFGNIDWLEFKDAGNGWVYGFFWNDLYLGKMEGGKLNGPAFMYSSDKWHTFYTGQFKDGKLASGMKLRDEITIIQKNGSPTSEYKRDYTDAISGEFYDNQIKPSCSKLVRYNGKGKPVYMVEGYFYPSKNFKKEFADGWAYINDWDGKRDAANLQYMYSGENYLTMTGEARYVSWFTTGLKESETAAYCYPSIKAQSIPLIALMKNRHDSVYVLANKLEKDIAAYKAAWQKREATNAAACATERAKYTYATGDLYQVGDGYNPVKILIAGPYNCNAKSFPVFIQNWVQSTKNSGYMNTASSNMSAEKLKEAKKIASSQGVCGTCGGKSSVPKTVYTDVGGSSGYTNVGGGWAIKNPETYWKSEIMEVCNACKGTGFVGGK